MDLVIRTAVVFLLVYALTRFLGRRELGSLEPFDLILLVVIGDLVQQGITQSDESVTGTAIVLATVGLLTVAVSYLSFRFGRLRPALEGEPIVLVADGRIIERNMRRERVTIDDITSQARLNQIDSLREVQWAVLETGGQISFIRKEGQG